MADASRLPPVVAIRRDGDRVELDLVATPELPWFHGHFPGSPILPGVVQIDWALGFARRELGVAAVAARHFQVKFKAVIAPGDRPTLVLTHLPAKGRVAFEYRRGDELCSSGQLTVAP